MMRIKTSVENPPLQNASDAPHKASDFSKVSRVGWLRLGALGDLLVSMACLAETARLFPRAKVTVFGPSLWKDLIDPRLWPFVDKVVVIVEGRGQEHTFQSGNWMSVGPAKSLVDCFQECQATVNLRIESLRYAWPALRAKVPIRMGTCPPLFRFLYTHWSPWLGQDPIVHERDRMLEILEAPSKKTWATLSTQYNRSALKFKQTGVVGKGADKWKVHQPNQGSNSLAAKWAQRGLPAICLADPVLVRMKYSLVPDRYVLINPTASRWEKAWPKEKFAALAQELQSKLPPGQSVVIIGSPSETKWLEEVRGASDIKIVQPQSLQDLIQVVALARALVANTSSMQFIAAATKTRCFTLMGRTFPARWGPLGPKDAFICGRQQSPPPKDIFLDDHTAYDSLSVIEVATAIERWIS
jgi:ADP-heptose:LPS heptosyltransferase